MLLATAELHQTSWHLFYGGEDHQYGQIKKNITQLNKPIQGWPNSLEP